MMKKLLTLLFVFFSANLSAQVLPMEKLLLITDKQNYRLADTIQISGKLVRTDTDSTLVPYSSYFYVELFDQNDSIHIRKKMRCEQSGNFQGKIPLFLSRSGIYYLRAYSLFMGNYSTKTFPIVPLTIGNAQFGIKQDTSLSMEFYPEGGQFHEDIQQNIAVRIKGAGNANKRRTQLYLIENDNDTLTTFTTTPNGWQIISFIPRKGVNYHIYAKNGEQDGRFIFPAYSKRPGLQIFMNKKRMIYTYRETEAFKNLSIYVFHSHLGLQRIQNQTSNGQEHTGFLLLDNLSEGLVSVFLCSEKGEVLAQSSRFHESTIFNAHPNVERTIKSKEKIDISLSEELPSEDDLMFHARILPNPSDSNINFYLPSARQELCFTQDLDSPEPFPSILANATDAEQKLDESAWLLSSKFKRFDVSDALKNGLSYKNKPENTLTLKGRVTTIAAWKVDHGNILAYRNLNNQVTSTETDSKGYFILPVEDFGEGETFYMQAYDKREKTEPFNYSFESDTLPALHNWNRIDRFNDQRFRVEVEKNANKFSFDEANLLPSVTVRGKINQPTPVDTKQFYAVRTINHEKMQERNITDFKRLVEYFTAFIYLREDLDMRGKNLFKVSRRIAEDLDITQSLDRGTKSWVKVYSRRGGNVVILLDGKRVDAEDVYNYNMDEIESAEFFSPADAIKLAAGAIGGVLYLKTKSVKPEEKKTIGVYYTPPFGIANLDEKTIPTTSLIAPEEKGSYLILIDLISRKWGYHTFSIPIEITSE